MAEITTTLTESISQISTNLMSVLAQVVPLALAIVGAVMVVKFGINAFRSMKGSGKN